jgi:hypothetical protein
MVIEYHCFFWDGCSVDIRLKLPLGSNLRRGSEQKAMALGILRVEGHAVGLIHEEQIKSE